MIAQRQYVLPSAQLNASAAAPAPASTQDALSRLLPGASLPLALAITAFASPDSTKAIVRVSVDAGAFAHADGSAAPLEVAVMAVDGTGKSLASAKQTSTISVSARRVADPPTSTWRRTWRWSLATTGYTSLSLIR